MIFKSINPFNLETVAEYAPLSDSQIEKKLDKAAKAFKSWKKTSFAERATLMHKVAAILRRDSEKLATLMTIEMGKIIGESRAEIEKTAGHVAYFAQNTEGMLHDEKIPIEGHKAAIAFDPIGCIFAIMPWNYPFWQVLRYAAPTIMGGNVTILKHAPNVFGCATAIETVFTEAGFPEGVFQSLIIDTHQTERIIEANIVQGVTLTGSEYAGSAVAALAGKHIKKTVLELGGSDPFIVLADADVEKAAKIATQSRMMNAGQACICAKRFIVVDAVREAFTHHFQQNIAALTQGNPFDPSVHLGPMARLDLAEKLSKQLEISTQQGAIKVLGGERDNCHFKPTLLTNVKFGVTAFDEETFGPLATIVPAKNEAKAIELANNHRYGLAAAVWTKDLERGYKVARQIESGNVFVNNLVRSDSRLPFGGVKKSGYGRELSAYGLKEFMNWKTILIAD
ncbi:MAG: NAD-dependent succinate-semialdehyde dehydrogenase [Saprospiraceae bacterium]|nr:NAD-dependent succinate-semialdehyde dehydrogenase [Saprospiraceae bacterium]